MPKRGNLIPLGYIALGMSTLMLGLYLTTLFESLGGLDSVVPIGVNMGGLAQVIIGLLLYFRGSSREATAFLSVGLFWLGYTFLGLGSIFGEGGALTGFFYLMWLILVGTFALVYWKREERFQSAGYAGLALCFFFQALAHWTQLGLLSIVGGVMAVLGGAPLFYLGLKRFIDIAVVEPGVDDVDGAGN